jgi:hypothetical protein
MRRESDDLICESIIREKILPAGEVIAEKVTKELQHPVYDESRCRSRDPGEGGK